MSRLSEASDASAARPIIELERVSMRFGRQMVLRDIDLAIYRGETVAILGESGCGKTVTLKLMIGLLRPTAGRVRFDGRDLAGLSDKELTRLRTRFGFLFQGAALFDSMTVADNIAFPLREHTRRSDDEIADIVRQCLHEVGLSEDVRTKKPAELSGGMKKRVGLARALAMNPEVMLYDEPTTGLDPIMSDVINELILRTRGLRKPGFSRCPVTSVLVTHDMRTAHKTADRMVMLYPLSRLRREGKAQGDRFPGGAEPSSEPQVLFDGTPLELLSCGDPRVQQFVRGEAGERLEELGVGA